MSFLCIRWTPDGKTLIAAGGRSDLAAEPGRNVHGVIRFFDRDSGAQAVGDQRRHRPIDGPRFLPRMAADLAAVKAALRSARLGPALGEGNRVDASHDAQNPHLAISANGKLIAMTRPDGTVSLWDGEGRCCAAAPSSRTCAGSLPNAPSRPDGESLALPADGCQRATLGRSKIPILNSTLSNVPKVLNELGRHEADFPIPAGEYMMGMPMGFVLPQNYQPSVAPGTSPQHRVRISHPC